MLHICKKFRQQIDNLSIQLLLLILNGRSFSPMQRLLAPLNVRRRQFVSIICSFFGFRFVEFATRLFVLLCVPVEVECHFGANELGGVTLVLGFFVNIPFFHLGCQINIFFASISDKYSIFGLKFWAIICRAGNKNLPLPSASSMAGSPLFRSMYTQVLASSKSTMESYSKLRFSLSDAGFSFAGKARKAFVLA